MANPNGSPQNLLRGGVEKRVGAVQKLGVAYRNSFSKADLEEFAELQKEFIRDPSIKAIDRNKIIQDVLKKLVSDLIPEEDRTPPSIEEIKEALDAAGFELRPKEPSA